MCVCDECECFAMAKQGNVYAPISFFLCVSDHLKKLFLFKFILSVITLHISRMVIIDQTGVNICYSRCTDTLFGHSQKDPRGAQKQKKSPVEIEFTSLCA